MSAAPLRVLVHVTLTTMLRHFTGVIRSLAARGHDVRIAMPEGRSDVPPPASLLDQERITFVTCPPRRGDAWAEKIYELRSLRDYLRYLDDPFAQATKLRARAMRQMVKALTGDRKSHLVARCPRCDARLVDDEVSRSLLAFHESGRARVMELMRLMEDTIPSDPTIEAFLQAERPDVLVVTPLIKIGSYQADYVKSAKAIAVPVIFPVFSWDNLSTKGLIHVVPDQVLVWNERQRTEAIELHGIAPERVVATGAPRFDEFFAMTPQVTREKFCKAHRFDATQPIVTYLCSSEFVAGRESAFVLRWIDEIRQEPALRRCNILIRPHPREKGQWKTFTAPAPHVAVSFPSSISVDQSLFDTVYHSAAVVGLNTSAQLEAGIVGRPVLTILADDFAGGQQGTLHFHYLLKDHGGFVEVAPDFETHRSQLDRAVRGEYDPVAIRRFIEYFLRPLGWQQPATPIMVDAIEAMARSGRHHSATAVAAHS